MSQFIGCGPEHSERMYDLASLTKMIVTAPIVLKYFDGRLDEDMTYRLGFTYSNSDGLDPDTAAGEILKLFPQNVTIRKLLSHSAGLPAWLPFLQGESLASQLARGFPAGKHPLLQAGTPNVSLYSDLNFRLLGQLIEEESGCSLSELGHQRGLKHAPWSTESERLPICMPDGPDIEAWSIATDSRSSPVPRSPSLAHDANSRAGMTGHAGFAATAQQLRQSLLLWVNEGNPLLMARPTSKAKDGQIWGLGMWRAHRGKWRYGDLLERIPRRFTGVYVLEEPTVELEEPVPPEEAIEYDCCDDDVSSAVGSEEGSLEAPVPAPKDGIVTAEAATQVWWMHTGFTGPAIFVRPGSSEATRGRATSAAAAAAAHFAEGCSSSRGSSELSSEDDSGSWSNACVIAVLCHRKGPAGQLLSAEERRHRLYRTLESFVESSTTG